MKRPKLGQVFLHDKHIIDRILNHVQLTVSDKIIEVGCGAGILTCALEKTGVELTVVEFDEACITKTRQVLPIDHNVIFIHDDILKVDYETLAGPLRMVANIPYYLSAKLIQQLGYAKHCFSDITIMVQKEFAEKCCGKPGSEHYTSLSIFTQFHFDCEYLFTVSKGCFTPPPKVDSAMLRLRPKKTDPKINSRLFERIVQAAFWGKRKKISTALNKNPFVVFQKPVQTCSFFSQHQDSRADHLSLAQYVVMYHEMIEDKVVLPDQIT